MKVTVNPEARTITIELPIDPRPSSTGKSTLVASTGGFVRNACQIEGKGVDISVNCKIDLPAPAAQPGPTPAVAGENRKARSLLG